MLLERARYGDRQPVLSGYNPCRAGARPVSLCCAIPKTALFQGIKWEKTTMIFGGHGQNRLKPTVFFSHFGLNRKYTIPGKTAQA